MSKALRSEISAQLNQFLYGARIGMVRNITLDQLLARYGGKRKEVEYAWTIALQKRAGEQ